MPELFDPDAFLAEKSEPVAFDPDAFLASPEKKEFDPDAFLKNDLTTTSVRDRTSESGYRDIAAKVLGNSTQAQKLAGKDPGVYQRVKGSFNETGDASSGAAEALAQSGGDVDKAIAANAAYLKQQSESYDAAGGDGLTIDFKRISGTGELLKKLKEDFDTAGVPATERPRIIADAAKANAWTEKDTDNIRKLSTGELVINPGRLFGQRDKLIADINASDATPEDKTEAIERLDAMRAASAEKLAGDLYSGDTRLPGITEFRDFAAANEGKDTATILDEWSAQQKGRGLGWKMIDGLVSGIAKGGLGIQKTVVGGLAGVTGSETLAAGQQLLADTREGVSQAEKFRGAEGLTSDLADTVTQMAPMFIGGAAGAGLKGLSQKVVQGMSVYGWAAAQGYESKLSDAVDMAREKKGSELTPEEVTEVLGRRETQVAGFLNGAQTALLAKVLGGGAERAALGQVAKSMTVRDFVLKGGAAALRDGTLKTELKAMGRTILKDATDESVEEFTNQVLDEAISTVALGKDLKLGDLLENAVKAGALGGLVGGALPQFRTGRPDPAIEASRDLVAEAASVAPASAAAALETGTPNLGETNDNEQFATTAPLEVPVPTVPSSDGGATDAGNVPNFDNGSPLTEGTATTLNDETPNLEIPGAPAPADPEPAPTEENLPEEMSSDGLQPTSGGSTVAESEEILTPSTNVPDPQRQENEATSPQAAQPTLTETGAPGDRGTGDAASSSTSATEQNIPVQDAREKLLAELGNPVDPGFPDVVQVGDSKIELKQEGDKIKVSVATPEGLRGNGSAAAAMQKVVDLARRDGVTLDLDVEPGGNDPATRMNREQLTAWYGRLGFTDNGDGTMTLVPSNESKTPKTLISPDEIKVPNFDAALEDDSVTGLYHAQTDADRLRLGLPPRFKQPRTTDQEAWDRATAAEDAHRAAGLPGTAGTDLLTNLLNDVPRVLTKEEHALLLHEKLVREQAVEATQARLNNLPSTTPDGERKDIQAAVKKAQDAFDLLITYADAAGSRAGLSLQARKMLIRTDFSLAAVVNRLKAAKNMNSDGPVKWSEKDQKDAIEIAEKLQQAQERVEALEVGNSEKDALIEQLTQDVERAQTKLENRMRASRARKLVQEKLDPLVEAAKARMAARKVPTDQQGNFATFGPTPEQIEDLKDIAIIASGWIANKALTLEEFSRKLTAEFGDWVSEHAQTLFRNARSLYIETAESVTGDSAPTPESVVEGIDATEPLDKADVWKLARAHVVSGKRGRNVLDAVFGDLSQLFPDITRDDVSVAFTGYGTVVYPSDKEVPKELRRIRSLEREYSKQLDIAAGQMPKRTGTQTEKTRGPEWAEVRAEQQKTADALRELENQLREAGLPVPSDERKLASTLSTMKRRLTNEIEEIELALASNTARTPKSRTPITPDAETAALQVRLKEKRAEYDQVFKDETAREKRILGSLKKRRLELERRMNERDFSKPEVKPPVNTEAKRKADYEFAKTRARYEEMRNEYLLDNAPFIQRAGHYALSTGNLLKILTLGGDIGVVMRQLGTTYQAITRDLGMLAPTKEGAKRRADGAYLKKILREGIKAFGSKEYEHSAYERLMERPNAGWDKTAGLVLSAPFDIQRNTKEDIPAANLLDSIPWWVWPAFAGVKVSLLGASFPVSATLLALGTVTKPFLQSLDRAQRAMTNESRALFFDEALANLHDGHPTVAEAKAIAKAVMVGTGRGSAPQWVESGIPLLNQVLLATRYYISRIQALTLYPLLNKDARADGSFLNPSDAQKEIAKMYARSVAGRAVMYGLAAAAFGKALTGGDDDPEEGLIVDPRNPNFGRVKLADGVSLDYMSGLNNFASAATRYFWKQRVEPETGKVIPLGGGFSEKVNDVATNFLRSKMNLQLSFLVNTHSGAYYGGKPVTFATAFEEISTAIIVNDTFNTYRAMMEEYGPVKGAARASLFLSMMFGGAGTSVRDSEAEKEANAAAKKEAEWGRKLREANLNE